MTLRISTVSHIDVNADILTTFSKQMIISLILNSEQTEHTLFHLEHFTIKARYYVHLPASLNLKSGIFMQSKLFVLVFFMILISITNILSCDSSLVVF